MESDAEATEPSGGELEKREASPPFERAVQKLADEKPDALYEMLAVTGASMVNPIHSKIEPEHISKILDYTFEREKQESALALAKENNATLERQAADRYREGDRKRTQGYIFAIFVVLVALIVLILVLFRTEPQLLLPLITGVGGLATGFLGGYGAGRNQGK